ncbi:hypothetical protein A4X06_0g9756 [Tilletia controversa]|uniref:Uncharacterized protein n=1 Tax=Tilletia controversa TaxID=13291 RepID=A0A8X7SRT3_9BASI|nr:hypothetical protein A4X06_0g9756 [Tilletia controversa]
MSPASGRSGRIGVGAGAGVGGSASRKALSSANDGDGDGDGDGEGEGEGNDDPFASPSAWRAQRRAQRRLPSHQGGNKGTPVLGSGIGGAGTGAGAGPTTMSLSALIVSPNLNEVDFAALLRTNLGGGGSVGHDLGSLLTGSPVRLCSRAL